MIFTDLMKESGYEISLVSISSEPRTNDAELRIIVNRSKEVSDLLIYPHPDSQVKTIQIDFPNYITYAVVYDDYTVWNDNHLYTGDSFRIYEKSSYLDYVQKEFRVQDKNLKHYSLACFEHQVDIISEYEPIITVTSL